MSTQTANTDSSEESTTDLPYPLYQANGRVICQECGSSFEQLKHHLTRGHDDLTVSEYREKWGDDAPMMKKDGVAPSDVDFPPGEMSIQEIADQADFVREEIAQLEGRLVELQDEMDTRKRRIEELNEVFESVVKSD